MCKEFQEFRVTKIPEVGGAVRIATSNDIVEMKGHDVGEEFMKETQLFEVVKCI